MKQNDIGIFLNRINYSDTSLIVTFYTLENGIQKFVFQGGKKKATALFPLSLCELVYYRRPDSELGKLTQASSYKMLHELTNNPLKATMAFYLIDVLKRCLQTDQKDAFLYHFIEDRITQLNHQDELSYFGTQFLIDFSHHMGIAPMISDTPKKNFYLQDGEFSDLTRNGELVANGPAVTLIQELQVKNSDGFSYTKKEKQEAFEIMNRYYKLHIPKFDVQKSLDIIHEILYG